MAAGDRRNGSDRDGRRARARDVVPGDDEGEVGIDGDSEPLPVTSKRAFHDGMRRLWVDHVTWTRLFIVSFAADLPDLHATTDRLLQNQVDIGNAVKPFYGKTAGDQLTALLTQHIQTAAELLAAAKAGDSTAFDQAKTEWYANARQIAGSCTMRTRGTGRSPTCAA